MYSLKYPSLLGRERSGYKIFGIISNTAFYRRIKLAEKTYIEAYEDEVESFIGRVKERARIRIEKAVQEYEEVSHLYGMYSAYISSSQFDIKIDIRKI